VHSPRDAIGGSTLIKQLLDVVFALHRSTGYRRRRRWSALVTATG
jgi:hypothetical protein